MNRTEKDKLRRYLHRTVLVLLGLGLAAATIWGIYGVLALKNPDYLNLFQSYIASLGVAGWLVLLAIQYLQIVIAFVPGGPIQIVAGALFGPVGGMLTCLLGTIAATATVFALVKRFGRGVLFFFVDEKDIQKYSFFSNTKSLERLILLLFFIPGTPKDALTYLFALTPIAFGRFALLSILARMPAMLTSVLAGDSVVNGQWLKAGILFVGITVITAGGFVLHKKIIRPHIRTEKKTG
ncbi:MAG: TVP38/TMEM64 family protein [Oscillospiraceae bacterium]|jgi:uncharacterized membrane protein YdjX (TVP38/TMEM64 family)